ncbi:cuticular protein 5 from Low Complexity family [Anopheles darlingi]|uniref:Cuticular protein 5 from Low Complexity family n=1 Tax=Anopheles darlingi TaxID=43151 RepID=W5J9H5_ANODA|nr:adult cuticle protein 1-like [Anopheles darlingi]ETN60058.1 cuticular protein 5 from Low Complexity family [Anopheles darlingi]
MKCIAAVVMVALAVAVEANPTTVYSVPTQTVVQQNVVPRYVTAYSAPAVTYASHAVAPVAAYAAPLAYAAHNTVVQSPVAYSAYAAPVAYANHQTSYVHTVPTVYAQVQKEATYVAATRGAVHTAPLVGHAVNQKSLNVEPAPGTL